MPGLIKVIEQTIQVSIEVPNFRFGPIPLYQSAEFSLLKIVQKSKQKFALLFYRVIVWVEGLLALVFSIELYNYLVRK